MATPEQFAEWSERVAPRAQNAFFAVLRRRGVPVRLVEQVAEEAVQEAWARAARCPEHFSHERGLSAWIVRVAARFNIDVLRRNGRYQALPEDVPERPRAPLAPFVELLRDEIDRLPAEDRDLVRRRYLDGATAAKIAQELIDAGDERAHVTVSIELGKRLRALRDRLGRALARGAAEWGLAIEIAEASNQE